MKIAARISISIFAIAAVFTVVVCAVVYQTVCKSLERQIYERLNVICDSRKAHIETYLGMLRSSIRQLSKNVVLENLLKAGRASPGYNDAFETAMLILERTREANPEISEFLLCDSVGIVIASSDRASMGQDKASDAFFVGGNEGIYIKDAYYSQVKRAPFLDVSAPVTDTKTGKSLGVVAARVRLDDLYSITADPAGLGNTGEVYIVNKYGYMVTPSRYLKETFLKMKVDTENLRRCRARSGADNPHVQRDEISKCRSYHGGRVVGTQEYLPEMQWCLMAEISAAEVFAPVRRFTALMIVILLTIPLLAMITGHVIANMITRPIRDLQKGTKMIGSGDLDHKVGTVTDDEIGQLSRAFDNMTGDLKSKIVSIDALNREVAERRAAEESLAESELRYKTLYDSSADAIMIFTPDRGFIDANTAALKLFDCAKEQFLRMGPLGLSPGYQPDGTLSAVKYREVLAAAIAKGSNFFEWKHRRPDGREFYATVLLTVMDLKGRKVFQATVRDITARKEADARLAEVIEAKDKFASTVSHEIRTPLTAIKEGIGIVLDGSAGAVTPEQRDFLTLAKRNVDRLRRLIGDVLDYEKLESGKASFYMRISDINSIAFEVIRLMSQYARAKSLEVVPRLAPGRIETICDPDRITQVLLNLVNNAIKFTASGKVTITTEIAVPHVIVSVQDTGIGIEKTDMHKLFKRFSQIGHDVGDEEGGIGLGLAISKDIIEEHNGEIWVESEPGRGARFYFKIPLKTKYRVLIVDQDKAAAEAGGTFLERAGYEVVYSQDASQAFESVQSYKPDIVILGINTPDLDIYDLLARLRTAKNTASLPVIAASAFAEDAHKSKRGKDDSPLIHLKKPFRPDELLSTVQMLLKQGVYGR